MMFFLVLPKVRAGLVTRQSVNIFLSFLTSEKPLIENQSKLLYNEVIISLDCSDNVDLQNGSKFNIRHSATLCLQIVKFYNTYLTRNVFLPSMGVSFYLILGLTYCVVSFLYPALIIVMITLVVTYVLLDFVSLFTLNNLIFMCHTLIKLE